ncbi:hypothetical protein NLX69_22805 [Rossellomorea sp. BNER]|nr:hypothetical protein [Rossellomorea sp. BNER]
MCSISKTVKPFLVNDFLYQQAIPYNKYREKMGGLSKELHDLLHEKQYAKEAILGLIETPDKNFPLGQYQKKHFDGMTISGTNMNSSLMGYLNMPRCQ